MPFFENAINCELTYSAMLKYDNVFKGNFYERFCMCLKFGDYENAKVKWSFGNMDKYFEWIDDSTGVFKVKDDAPNIKNIVLTATVIADGMSETVFKKTFNVKKKLDFKAGDGSETNPFLISSEEEFLKLIKIPFFSVRRCYQAMVVFMLNCMA